MTTTEERSGPTSAQLRRLGGTALIAALPLQVLGFVLHPASEELEHVAGAAYGPAHRILRDSPHIAVLMLTMLEDDDSVFEAMQAGPRGYLLKGALRAEILRAVRAVSSGEAIFGPAIARRLVQFFAAPQRRGYEHFPDLTDRERDILQLLAEHRTNPEIAARLSLAPKTVRNHMSNIFSKLQVATRAEAIVRARDAGLGSPPRT